MLMKESKANNTTKSEEDPNALSESEMLIAKLNEKVDNLEAEVSTMKDKYMRSLAETENVRQRLQRQITNTKDFAIQKFCKDLVDVSDILNIAVKTIPSNAMETNSDISEEDRVKHLRNLFEGLSMTNNSLNKVFNRHGLVAIDAEVGDEFDPNLHEATFQIKMMDKKSGSLLSVEKIGFKLNGRVIRASQVGVVQND
ncbi:hypothetical protein SNEBB_002049 [Seison nebaliae]|nr:hypothetical protein SNEBB_002049 [Seison nebaliae]